MDAADAALLAGAGFAAGAINAVAGGGSLLSFPALLAAGYPSVVANVTNNMALLPGSVGGALGYRRELAGQGRRAARLSVWAAVGGGIGSALLLMLPPSVFGAIVPFLILGACALLAAEGRVERLAAGSRRPLVLEALVFGVAVYGGYFGAGLGIALLAVTGLALDEGLHRLNALKNVLGLAMTAVAGIAFAVFGPVDWTAAGLMAVASLAGGVTGGSFGRRLPAELLRWLVVAFGVAVAVRLLV